MEDFLINANYLLNQLATFGEVMVEMCYVICFTTKISSFCLINLNLEKLAHVWRVDSQVTTWTNEECEEQTMFRRGSTLGEVILSEVVKIHWTEASSKER